ncbi:hypothetical protein [Corynebacterium pseudopelargi]|uniref:Uncharacterized protein n=1 Tax=Corynebacterium pseudopelargi TaxID=2080757 RepID=A0A3G6ITF4_9CORY|nr:hypothetical protein [Corynebacterium pseudopelargi]AZA08943.1 hypothetical protein CPPEL_04080 [Corynebacterium pseudopelargi]
MDTTDRARLSIAIGSLAALVILLVVLSSNQPGHHTTLHNGDVLGKQEEETFQQYQQRAHESLEGQGQRFALVTFAQPLSPESAGHSLETITRVNAVLLDSSAPLVLPEPVAPEGRADVIRRYQSFVAADDAPLQAAVVREDLDTLRHLEAEPHIAAVEALPEDAAWGHFGITLVRAPAA